MVIQDNFSSEKHLDRILGDTFMMLRNIRMTFHFLDKDMMRKILTTMIRPKLEYAEVIWSLHNKKRHCMEQMKEEKKQQNMRRQLKMNLSWLTERKKGTLRKNIIEKYKEEPKLFYRLVNGRMKQKVEISKQKK